MPPDHGWGQLLAPTRSVITGQMLLVRIVGPGGSRRRIAAKPPRARSRNVASSPRGLPDDLPFWIEQRQSKLRMLHNRPIPALGPAYSQFGTGLAVLVG